MEDLLEEWLSAPAAYPEARHAIEALDPVVREELNRALEPIDLRAGETLFTCGDPRDAAFLILSGRISLTEPGPQGGALPVRVFGAGEGVGEIGLAARGPYTATARALDDARVLRLGRIAFEGLCERHPEAMQGLPTSSPRLQTRRCCLGSSATFWGSGTPRSWRPCWRKSSACS